MMMGRRLGVALVVAIGLLGAAGCGSSSTSNNKCTTGTTTGGLGGGLGSSMCAATGTMTGGNAEMCQPTDLTDTCAVCLAQSCCSQTLACGNDAVCSACADTACFQSNQVGTNLLTCAENSCANQCM